MPRIFKDAFFTKLAALTESAASASEQLRLKVKSVRGLPVSDWPFAWSMAEVLSVALVSKMPVDKLLARFWAKWPGFFRRRNGA